MSSLHFRISFSLLSAFAFLATPVFSDEIRNGDFVDGLKGWVIQRDGFPTLTAKDAVGYCRFEDDGVILDSAAIENRKEKPASLILLQYLKELGEGVEYELSFEIQVPSGEVMTCGLGIPVDLGPDRGNLLGGVQLFEVVGDGQWTSVSRRFRWSPAEAAALGASDPASLQFRIALLTRFGIRHVRLESVE